MFAQCSPRRPGNPDGDNHEKCAKVMGGRYACICECPCHHGGALPANPCKRCNGTGKYGPWSVEAGRCFRCEGKGVEPSPKAESLK
jgi:hypothetical protein